MEKHYIKTVDESWVELKNGNLPKVSGWYSVTNLFKSVGVGKSFDHFKVGNVSVIKKWMRMYTHYNKSLKCKEANLKN